VETRLSLRMLEYRSAIAECSLDIRVSMPFRGSFIRRRGYRGA
jgi:hypothetical protein